MCFAWSWWFALERIYLLACLFPYRLGVGLYIWGKTERRELRWKGSLRRVSSYRIPEPIGLSPPSIRHSLLQLRSLFEDVLTRFANDTDAGLAPTLYILNCSYLEHVITKGRTVHTRPIRLAMKNFN